MRVYSESFSFQTRGEHHFHDLTDKVEKAVANSTIRDGIALIFAGHATGVIAMTEYESRLLEDVKELIARLIPTRGAYHHSGNAPAHLRSLFVAPSKVVPVRDGRLDLGTWQSIFWIETETHPRSRTVYVYVIGEEASQR
ncbi:MAG: secondary thiamine-phosphate synthase enzyme YjbQ [Thermoplasmata archaeon]